MDIALEVLEDAKSWDWPVVKCIQKDGNQGGKFTALIPQLLSCLIKESQGFHGMVLNQFWETVGKCHDTLKDNGASHSSTFELQGLTYLFHGANKMPICCSRAARIIVCYAGILRHPKSLERSVSYMTCFTMPDCVSSSCLQITGCFKSNGALVTWISSQQLSLTVWLASTPSNPPMSLLVVML